VESTSVLAKDFPRIFPFPFPAWQYLLRKGKQFYIGKQIFVEVVAIP